MLLGDAFYGIQVQIQSPGEFRQWRLAEGAVVHAELAAAAKCQSDLQH